MGYARANYCVEEYFGCSGDESRETLTSQFSFQAKQAFDLFINYVSTFLSALAGANMRQRVTLVKTKPTGWFSLNLRMNALGNLRSLQHFLPMFVLFRYR
jgi:hypothetical protein